MINDKAFTISSIILKGGSGKSFSIYMLTEYIREKLRQQSSMISKSLKKLVVADMDEQISLIGRFTGFVGDRRTIFHLDEKTLQNKIKVKFQFPSNSEFEESDLILIDNSPEYREIWNHKNLIDYTDLFIVPVNTISALDRVKETIDRIRAKETMTPAKIVLLFNDTMHLHKKVFNVINHSLTLIGKQKPGVEYWGAINHSKLVSLAELPLAENKSIYSLLKNTSCGKSNKRFAKYILNLFLKHKEYTFNGYSV